MTASATIDRDTERRDALVGRLFEAAIGTMDVFSVYVGDRLGPYRALADRGSATSGELAAGTGTDERYAREWLEQRAATGILEVEGAGAEATARRYRVPLGHREVLLDRDGLNWVAGLLRLVVGVTKPLPALLQAFHTGDGVPYSDYGPATARSRPERRRPTSPCEPDASATPGRAKRRTTRRARRWAGASPARRSARSSKSIPTTRLLRHGRGKSLSTVRISVGLTTNLADASRFVHFAQGFLHVAAADLGVSAPVAGPTRVAS